MYRKLYNKTNFSKVFLIILTLIGLLLTNNLIIDTVSGSKSTQRIDINNATQDELTQIHGIGDITAERIIENCSKFYSLTQLKHVDDIGKYTVRKIIEEGIAYVLPPEDEDWSLDENVCEDEEEKSYIDILSVPNETKFGSKINVELEIYRNYTSKYAVDVYVESEGNRVSEKYTIHLSDTEQKYNMLVPLQVDPNCNHQYNNGTYNIVAEGLDIDDSESIKIKGLNYDICETTEKTVEHRIPSYELLSTEKRVETGETITNHVLLENRKNDTKEYKIYSYVYEGNNPLNVGGWLGNAVNVTISPHSRKLVKLENTIQENVSTGEYNLRVRISDVKDITRNITVTESFEPPEFDVTEPEIGENKIYERKNMVDRLIENLLKLIPL